MRDSSTIVRILLISASVLLPSSAAAIPFGPDTFEDGTTMGWFVPGPSPNPPANVATGGPSGVGDAYLQLTADGGDAPGSRLAVLNGSQWTGDFLSAGITSITMDVNNFGPEDLVLRLLFEDFGPDPGPPINLALTLAGVVVPAGSGWMHVVFDLSLANLGALIGTVDGALSDVNTMRIFHNPNPDFPGPGVGIPSVNATVGVDNITAVPEPLTAILFACGLVGFLAQRRR